MRAALAALLLLAAPAAQARPVLVELFTSQACSSCPPADALLLGLAGDKTILPLSFNVTYWNGPAWTDPDSLQGSTDRQYWYAGLTGENVYTPEAVVDGTAKLVGSDRATATAAIAAARASPAGDVAMSVSGGPVLHINIGAGPGGGTIYLFGYDSRHVTRIGGGENGGALITEVNVVRSIKSLGAWHGDKLTLSIPRPAGEHMALVLQTASGAVLGIAAE